MTRIAAFIGDDVIVAVSDGKAVDNNMRTVDIRARKIFKLSPLCLVLASGRAPNHLMKEFETIGARYADEDYWQAEYIANDLVTVFNESVVDWLKGASQTFIVAGYNHTGPTFEPKLFALLQRPEGWVVHTSIDGLPFIIAGNRAQQTHEKVAQEVAVIPADTAGLNKYALKMLKQSAALTPDSIGGAPGLWNIYPSLDTDIKRFLPNDILAL